MIVQEKSQCLNRRKDGISHCKNNAYLNSQTDTPRKKKERNRKLKLEREDLQITNHKKISTGGLRQPV